MKPRLPALPLAILLAVAVAILAAIPGETQQAPASGSDQLFKEIYPVYAHDRCANCHGVVKHYPGIIRSVMSPSHPGGEVGDPKHPAPVDCSEDCHNAREVVDKWKFTAPPTMEWAGLSEEQVCVMQAAEVHLMNGEAGGDDAALMRSYLHHLTTDPLITQAWHGHAGGARYEKEPDLPHPPLPRTKFLERATDWVKAGAPCRAMGTLSQTEKHDVVYEGTTMGGKVNATQHATRSVNIVRYPDGTAHATVMASGSNEMVLTHFGEGGCTVVVSSHETWTRTGPAGVDAKVEVTVTPDSYSIYVALPEETTRTTTSSDEVNNCGGRNITVPAEKVDLKWPEWHFTIDCPTIFKNNEGTTGCEPKEAHDKGAATGAMHVTVEGESDAEVPRSWLNHSPVPTGRPDSAEALPIEVQTTWALRLDAQ